MHGKARNTERVAYEKSVAFQLRFLFIGKKRRDERSADALFFFERQMKHERFLRFGFLFGQSLLTATVVGEKKDDACRGERNETCDHQGEDEPHAKVP